MFKYEERLTAICPQCQYYSYAGFLKKHYKNGDEGYYCRRCGCLFDYDYNSKNKRDKKIIRKGKKQYEKNI